MAQRYYKSILIGQFRIGKNELFFLVHFNAAISCFLLRNIAQWLIHPSRLLTACIHAIWLHRVNPTCKF